ncbi:MAG: hypothetical protein EPO67_10600 [Reyranella sp.]|nr:MAG: hypothetical protein EPO67_10600 [Reyranella sp.]
MAIVDAFVFWLRRQSTFWILSLAIAGLAAAIAYLIDARSDLGQWRRHWGLLALFAAIYTLFLDRWIKEALLDGADPCEETDNLRRSVISLRFVVLAALLIALAFAVAEIPVTGAGAVIWVILATPLALMLPSFSANEPLSPVDALSLGAPVFFTLLLTIGGATALSILAAHAAEWILPLLPPRPWAPAGLAAATTLIDCLLLAFAGHILAALYRERSGWQQPEPEERPYRAMRWRKA